MRNRWWLIPACLVVALPGAAAYAQHENSHGSDQTTQQGESPRATAQPAEHNDHGDKPPLLSFDPGVAIWTIIVFVLLLAVLRGAAWKPILKVLKDREQFIQQSIEGAKRERAEADKLLARYREQIDRAREQATAIVDEGRRDAEDVRRRIHEEARRESDQMIERAKREIQLATDAAVKQLYDQTADLAVQVAAGIVRKELSADDHKDMVAESLERMKSAHKARMN